MKSLNMLMMDLVSANQKSVNVNDELGNAYDDHR